MKNEIRQQLLSPDPSSRGWTRWWWFGMAVTREEIARELDLMLEAQIGGVELQILYPLYADDPEKNIKNQWYLSPEFFDLLIYTAEEAKKRGMLFDLTLGSSWPFGGPFVPKELSAPNVIPYLLDVKGPCTFHYDFTTRVYGECVGCVMGRMEACQMVPDTIVDITDKVVDKYLFGWPWGLELKDVEIPEGDYKIAVFISNEKRQTVLKPLPGGDGLIIDHDRKDALRHFLKHAADPIADKMGNLVQSYFCDSLEVFGQNWTDIIYEEFERRRGYDLHPWLYALWGEIKGYTDKIRYDYNKTLAELTEENFYRELTAWCHERGNTSRIQAHGTWADILKAYAAADIPEGETFSEFDRYEVNTVHRRLAVSSGHVYQKPVISNESFTWLRFPRFTVTLENMKAAVDSIFLDGINHIVNHGFAYSPEESGKLGWPFYASTQINHKNTWWPFYKDLGTYINRVSQWMKMGKQKVKIAIYLPQSDIWAENPMSDIHMCMKLEERLSTAVVDKIQKAGYWFDYVNDDVVQRFSEYDYEALILLECDRIPLETAQAMGTYVKAGGMLICKGHTPQMSCGLSGYEERSEKIREIFEQLSETSGCVVAEDSAEGIIQALQKRIVPDVQFQKNPDQIGYVHRIDNNRDIYFISNISSQWLEEEIRLEGQDKPCVIFDPMTAEEKTAEAIEKSKGSSIVKLILEPFQSLLLIFDDALEVQTKASAGKEDKEEVWMDLSENWEFTVPETGFAKRYQFLNSWEQEKELYYFSGEGIYTKVLQLSGEEKDLWLTFEHLGEAAEVWVNGILAGRLIKRPYRIQIGHLLKIGENTLEVRVRNLLINCAIDPDFPEQDYPQEISEWPYDTGRLNGNRKEWLYNQRERESVKEPFPSGMWGRIVLKK